MSDLVRRLLARAIGRKRDPTEPVTGAEQKVKELLEDLLSRYEAPSGKLWIFTYRPDTSAYVRAVLDVLEDEVLAAKLEAWNTKVEPGSSCACRCRVHSRTACPKCLIVERCPVHAYLDDDARPTDPWDPPKTHD